MAGAPYEAGGIRVTVDGHPGRDRRRSSAGCAAPPAPRRAGRASRPSRSSRATGSTVDRRAALPARSPRRCTADDHLPRRPRRPARVRGPRRRLRRARVRRHADRARAPHARWVDVVLRAGRLRRRPVPGRARPPGAHAGLGLRLHANQLGPDPGCSWPSSWAAPRSTTAPTSTDADVDALAGERDRGDVPAGHRLLDPPALPGRPAGDRRRRHGRAGDATATRARATRRRWRSASRSPCATCT